ncbi:hypothetical protein BZA05DRAFT_131627 [Tricharina praecox]|uniref:uncharacterized protein n=1 Tax=Tricharina praecox TaxID=43433 RepID=UPI00221EBDD0|nr:uncharacterized protein BZA05DRAFT_131627 [Tricharina praecox]KAI5846974.1 hypothetical protein BZA05DRAFT_131627 [Tricharina praecox]
MEGWIRIRVGVVGGYAVVSCTGGGGLAEEEGRFIGPCLLCVPLASMESRDWAAGCWAEDRRVFVTQRSVLDCTLGPGSSGGSEVH